MSHYNHVEMLKLKHAQLEKSLHSEALRPLPDQQLILELKQKKLKLKDEIHGLLH